MVAHEASISKISPEQKFYLRSRGLTENEAEQTIVLGFLEPLLKELPMCYAMPLNRPLYRDGGHRCDVECFPRPVCHLPCRRLGALNSNGKTISLVQQGIHTARNRNSVHPAYPARLKAPPPAMRIWNREAHVLRNTCPA